MRGTFVRLVALDDTRFLSLRCLFASGPYLVERISWISLNTMDCERNFGVDKNSSSIEPSRILKIK